MKTENLYLQKAVEDVSDETILAMLHFKEAEKQHCFREYNKSKTWERITTDYDVKPFMPKNPVIFMDVFDEDRLFTDDPESLLSDPSERFDNFEMMQICSGDIKYRWNGVRKKKGAFRAFVRPGCDVFWESCQRTVYKDGREDIHTALFGWNLKKKIAISCPIPEHRKAAIMGCERGLEKQHVSTLVLMASIAEDIAVNWSVTIKKESAFTLYSTEARIKDLCALRDAPMTESGRRAAICHWVRGHKRRVKNESIDINRFLRGVTHFPLGDMQVTLTPPTGLILANVTDLPRLRLARLLPRRSRDGRGRWQ